MRRFSRRRVVVFLLGAGVLLLGAPLAMFSRFAAWHPQMPVNGLLEDLNGDGAPAGEVKVRLATWNVWGLPFGTPKRAERMRAIAGVIAEADVDVVCFQEVFLESDRRVLCEELADAGLPHHRYFSSFPCGSGLLTVSRHPITEAVFLRFRRQGNPLALRHGDWWAGKGAGLVGVKVPGFGKVRIINTHVHARYGSDLYKTVRESQVGELVRFAETAREAGAPVFLAGDLNYWEKDARDAFWTPILEKHGLRRMSRAWSAIDYILGFEDARYRLRHTGGKRLDGTLEGEADGIPLSDHKGIVTDVRIMVDESRLSPLVPAE